MFQQKSLWVIICKTCCYIKTSKTHALNIFFLPLMKYDHKLYFKTCLSHWHYSDVTMSVMASQITCVSIVYLTVCSGADQRKHQSSASLAFVREINRWPVNSPHKGPVTQKMFPFDDVIMEINPHKIMQMNAKVYSWLASAYDWCVWGIFEEHTRHSLSQHNLSNGNILCGFMLNHAYTSLKFELQYYSLNMHIFLLCFVLIWLYHS